MLDDEQSRAAITFGRMWATLLLEGHLESERPVPSTFPGQTDDAWLLSGQVTNDPIRRLEATTVIRRQAEESWSSMTGKVFGPHRRPFAPG